MERGMNDVNMEGEQVAAEEEVQAAQELSEDNIPAYDPACGYLPNGLPRKRYSPFVAANLLLKDEKIRESLIGARVPADTIVIDGEVFFNCSTMPRPSIPPQRTTASPAQLPTSLPAAAAAAAINGLLPFADPSEHADGGTFNAAALADQQLYESYYHHPALPGAHYQQQQQQQPPPPFFYHYNPQSTAAHEYYTHSFAPGYNYWPPSAAAPYTHVHDNHMQPVGTYYHLEYPNNMQPGSYGLYHVVDPQQLQQQHINYWHHPQFVPFYPQVDAGQQQQADMNHGPPAYAQAAHEHRPPMTRSRPAHNNWSPRNPRGYSPRPASRGRHRFQ